MKTIIRNFINDINTFQGSYHFECSGIGGRFAALLNYHDARGLSVTSIVVIPDSTRIYRMGLSFPDGARHPLPPADRGAYPILPRGILRLVR